MVKDSLRKLNRLLELSIANNAFYRPRLDAIRTLLPLDLAETFSRMVPLTSKSEWIADQKLNPPYGTNLAFPLESYTRCHQTSGTTGAPMRWLDTPETWNAMLDAWGHVFQGAGTQRSDRVFFAFSFGPFLGFWTAFESAQKLGLFCLSGGSMSSETRLKAMLQNQCTVLCCTPTYAMHLGEVARDCGFKAGAFNLHTIIVAGEPGGSLPAVRELLKKLWPTARVYDHHGMTEVGPVSYECPKHPCRLHVIKDAFVAEVIDPKSLEPIGPGEQGELILTTLDRIGSPLIRYRTGDLVEPMPSGMCECGSSDLALAGGIIGRCDDMVVVRGVNIYPSAVDQIVRECGGISEYRVDVKKVRNLAELEVTIEPDANVSEVDVLVDKISRSFQLALALRVPVKAVPLGSLPRFEMKAKRWNRELHDNEI
ncbi:MAG: AMP-binding protein [Verrucomicrobia bacterium]|jgi:phenylacetate-CoA ligase|nr:AMP-binding protein [Verrucomicrobiota bacterium]